MVEYFGCIWTWTSHLINIFRLSWAKCKKHALISKGFPRHQVAPGCGEGWDGRPRHTIRCTSRVASRSLILLHHILHLLDQSRIMLACQQPSQGPEIGESPYHIPLWGPPYNQTLTRIEEAQISHLFATFVLLQCLDSILVFIQKWYLDPFLLVIVDTLYDCLTHIITKTHNSYTAWE